MPTTALIFGALLVALGPLFYSLGATSFTAFIPSLIGVFIAAFGLVARNPSQTKNGLHGAAAFALLGLVGSLMGAKNWPALLTGQTLDRPLAAAEQLVMFLLCATFVALCVRHFRATRRAKKVD